MEGGGAEGGGGGRGWRERGKDGGTGRLNSQDDVFINTHACTRAARRARTHAYTHALARAATHLPHLESGGVFSGDEEDGDPHRTAIA